MDNYKVWTVIQFHNGGKIYTTGGLHISNPVSVITMGGKALASVLTIDIHSVRSVQTIFKAGCYREEDSDGNTIKEI